MLARFTTADTILDTDEISGMNRYMYVGGNPVKFNDPSGHRPSLSVAGAIIGYMYAEQYGLTKEQGALVGFAMNYGKKRQTERNSWERSDFGSRSDIPRTKIGRGYNSIFDLRKNPIKTITRSDFAKLWDNSIGRNGLFGIAGKKISKYLYYVENSESEYHGSDYITYRIIEVLALSSNCKKNYEDTLCNALALVAERHSQIAEKRYKNINPFYPNFSKGSIKNDDLIGIIVISNNSKVNPCFSNNTDVCNSGNNPDYSPPSAP